MFEFMNNPATVWVLIPVAAIIMAGLRPAIRGRSEASKDEANRTNELVSRQAVRIDELEKRLHVLERIATDRSLPDTSASIAAQIEQLRDEQRL